ncbi:GDSL-type esterase/lipase family protein [Gilvimarinus xylanilyticus]|uniref:GDSL-type esterase/lipase family protein n=1 Tax=Gilvimarinus xylanilyticus TaxID=2944139 RepID=A0A9X2HZC2_9GAMM|nr:GDSL-type esterase/lipase family protein [Gilvimarinus xylanilyticus]MCP8897923.1 GDSL-type esterase/lipase family protein [Gilvimarinus xylanilyticus]
MKLSQALTALSLATVTGFFSVFASAAPLSVQPVPRTQQFDWMSVSGWYERHAADVALAEQGEARIVFLGDSITEGWDHTIWQEHFAPLDAVNFAIGGDLTQNMLWRFEHGNVEKLDPELVVLMAGVNNYLHNQASPEDTFAGVQQLLSQALAAYPNAHVILQAVLPFGEQPNTTERQWVKDTNRQLQTLAAHERVDFYDFGELFLQDDGRISNEIMGDYLHPNAKGYGIWVKSLLPVVKSALDKE